MSVTIHTGDVLAGLAKIESGTVQTCVTSPPYWGLRDYGTARWEGGDAACDHKMQLGGEGETSQKQNTSKGTQTHQYRDKCGKCGAVRVDSQIGLEPSPDAYVARMVEVFREVRRCLRDDGTLFLNLGDSYASGKLGRNDADRDIGGRGGNKLGSGNPGIQGTVDIESGLKPKDLCMIPWRVALALQADGWWLRSVIVWAKKSPMPESVTDRPTSSWEPIFLLAKSERYYYDHEAVREPVKENSGKNMRAPKLGDHRADGNYDTVTEKTYERVCGANQRNVWHLGPEPYAEAHFATFPTEIPRRCILAGTSEKGCCAKCGAGWVRVVEKFGEIKNEKYGDVKRSEVQQGGIASTTLNSVPAQVRTIGWEPSCQCNAGDPVPCLVLEPFLGSGTTLAVAAQLGRNGVGCELNPEYVKLAQDRIGRATRPNTYQSDKAVDAPLFGVTL